MSTTHETSTFAAELRELRDRLSALADRIAASDCAPVGASCDVNLAAHYCSSAASFLRSGRLAKRTPTKAIYADTAAELCSKIDDDDAQARLLADLSQRFEGLTREQLGHVSVLAEAFGFFEADRGVEMLRVAAVAPVLLQALEALLGAQVGSVERARAAVAQARGAA